MSLCLPWRQWIERSPRMHCSLHSLLWEFHVQLSKCARLPCGKNEDIGKGDLRYRDGCIYQTFMACPVDMDTCVWMSFGYPLGKQQQCIWPFSLSAAWPDLLPVWPCILPDLMAQLLCSSALGDHAEGSDLGVPCSEAHITVHGLKCENKGSP